LDERIAAGEAQQSSGCGNLFDPGGWRRAMIDWFSHNKEWIEFVIATVALWLLMMIAIHELDLRSAG
jgi:hypothetical protein